MIEKKVSQKLNHSIFFRALTGESIGSEDVAKFEPTDLSVGAMKNAGSTDF